MLLLFGGRRSSIIQGSLHVAFGPSRSSWSRPHRIKGIAPVLFVPPSTKLRPSSLHSYLDASFTLPPIPDYHFTFTSLTATFHELNAATRPRSRDSRVFLWRKHAQACQRLQLVLINNMSDSEDDRPLVGESTSFRALFGQT